MVRRASGIAQRKDSPSESLAQGLPHSEGMQGRASVSQQEAKIQPVLKVQKCT